MKKVNNETTKLTKSAILTLDNIKKDYVMGKGLDTVHALKGISLRFRKNEFVSILGPSGCGKTTLLNIIGGLDKYTDGELYINNVSTKQYDDHDWDVYRNHHIGFIFQSYNLIPHQTVLGNVELALTIAGYSKKERIEKAKKALDRVGLAGLYDKHPNQLSGGQCQRVAIARALVNEPDILLADEPTGALDTATSVQIMDLIKEISQEKLVIMVTHNPELADKYSSRIIRLLDGEVQSDSNPYEGEDIANNSASFHQVGEKAKMSLVTSFKLSFRNLYSKFKRTILVCIAGSIGIVGVSTVLAVSSGVSNYIDSMQDDMLSGNPITIAETQYDLNAMMSTTTPVEQAQIVHEAGYVDVRSMIEELVARKNQANSYVVNQTISQDYIDYVLAMNPDYYAAINLDYGIDVANNIYTNWEYTAESQAETMSLAAITRMYTSVLEETEFKDYASYITQLGSQFSQAPNNKDYLLSQYDLLSGDVATEKDEIMIVVNDNDQLTDVLLAQLGYYTQQEFINIIYKATESESFNAEHDKTRFNYNEMLGKEFTWYENNTIFTSTTSTTNPFIYKAYKDDSFTDGLPLKVVGILKPKDTISYGCLKSGFYYTEALTKYELSKNINSEVINYYKEKGATSIDSVSLELGSTGITYKYYYYYEGTKHEDQTACLGKENSMSAFLGMISSIMGGGAGGATNPGQQSNTKYYTISLRELGGNDVANYIAIYPTNFEIKDNVTAYLDKWNSDETLTFNDKTLTKEQRDKTDYTDALSIIINLIKTMINIITYALIAFTALSLLVSTVMIGIITYVSVVERTKEIGVIRSIGGRKKDVSHLFNAEAFIIGLVSGVFGILITLLFSLIINLILGSLTGVYTIASLQFSSALIMILISILLTSISGVIPAKAAAKRDPVIALRTE